MKNHFSKLCLVILFSIATVLNANAAVIFTESIGTVAATTAISAHETANGFDNDSQTMSGTGDIRNTSPSSGYAGASGAANVFLTTGGTRTFQIDGINTTGYTGITLSLGVNKSATAENGTSLTVEYSTDGGAIWTPMTLTANLPTGAGTTGWHLVNYSTNLPASSSLSIRFTNTSTTNQFRLDDIGIQGTAAATCSITAISLASASACNDNGTNTNATDDYYTADVTVTYSNPPASGTLTLTGDVLAGGGSLTANAAFNATTTTFTGVRLKADGTATSITATFSADATCTFTNSTLPAVNACSVAPCNANAGTF